MKYFTPYICAILAAVLVALLSSLADTNPPTAVFPFPTNLVENPNGYRWKVQVKTNLNQTEWVDEAVMLGADGYFYAQQNGRPILFVRWVGLEAKP